MVQYPIPWEEIKARIDVHRPTWRRRAGRRATAIWHQQSYSESSSIWSEIKPVFMELQENKCAYCEKKLEGYPFTTIEHDLEHFRPKALVEVYPPAVEGDSRHSLNYSFSLGEACAPGYFGLAYHPLNYLASCKTCNTILKANYFPIHGTREPLSRDPRACHLEEPLLIYPLGDFDVDPEDAIEFRGVIPIPKVGAAPVIRRRAQVTIDFFMLDLREDLLRERANDIVFLYSVFRLQGNASDAAIAQNGLAVLTSRSYRHANCLRSFARLCQTESKLAKEIVEECSDMYPP